MAHQDKSNCAEFEFKNPKISKFVASLEQVCHSETSLYQYEADQDQVEVSGNSVP